MKDLNLRHKFRFKIKRVGIIGAGHFGGSIARDLLSSRRFAMKLAYFFDDDESKWNSRLHQVPIVGPPELIKDENKRIDLDELIIALPAESGKRIKEIVKLSSDIKIKCVMVPSIIEFATGRVAVKQLRNVQIQDLLGRDQIYLNNNKIKKFIEEKIVIVTGGGGSIGSELETRQVVKFNPKKLLVEQCEVQLFKIESELIRGGYKACIVPLVADILDDELMNEIFQNTNLI